MHVSHETIYLSLFVQSRGVLTKALQAQLRQRHTMRRPRTAAPKSGGYIVGAVSIRERPATVEDRAVPGHWEGDLLVGARQSYVATLVERRSRYVCLVRVAGRETRTVVQALTQHVRRLPDGLMATLTWDRGLELAAHRTVSIATGVQVYFCDPYSPWQRGTNENTNGLLRQYLPKGTDLARYTQPQLDAIARERNTRPRKTLGYRTPAGYTRGNRCIDRLNRQYLAAYDLAANRLGMRCYRRKRWREVLLFLRHIRTRYPRATRLSLVLDNFSPHRRPEVVAWATENNVELVFTPTYASWLNRIEAIFSGVRYVALANSDYPDHEHCRRAILAYVAWRNRHRHTELVKGRETHKMLFATRH